MWEFPGGKIRHSETVFSGLCRELHEEINIQVESADPLLQVPHDYSDYRVLLHFWRVRHFSGTVCPQEGQSARWVALSQLNHYDMPDANAKILHYLASPLFSL